MKGFASDSDSVFNQTIEKLDSILAINSALGIANSNTVIRRIGREASPSNKIVIKPIPSLLAARRPDFYSEKKGEWANVSSSIDQFVSKAPATSSGEGKSGDNRSLDILISDLEPDDASIKQFISAVKPKLEANTDSDKMEKQWNQLAIIGIRSWFTGDVYPTVQGDFEAFKYTGKRPFYIILLGPVEMTEQVITRLSQVDKISMNMQVSRFSSNPNFGKTVFVSIPESRLLPDNCINQVFALSDGIFTKLRVDNNNKWILGQMNRDCKANEIGVQLGTEGFSHFGINLDKIDYYQTNNAIAITKVSHSASKLALDTRLKVIPSRINLITINADTAKLDEAMWETWSASGSEPDGSKTQRLLSLINSLRNETDQYALNNYESKYSPLRVCAIIKT